MSKKRNKPDWYHIELAFRNGDKSIRAIADQYDVAESTIRTRAKKEGWERASPDVKRVLVSSTMALGESAHEIDNANDLDAPSLVVARARELMAKEVAFDVAIMQRHLETNQRMLDVIDESANQEPIPGPSDIKSLASAQQTCLSTFMSIRGLLPKDDDDKDLDKHSRDILKRFTRAVET